MTGSFSPKERPHRGAFSFPARIVVLAGWVFLGLCWLLPNHYRPWVSFHSEAVAGAALTLLITGLLLARPGDLRWPTVAQWVVVAAMVPWLQWATGICLFAGDALLVSYFLVGWSMAIAFGYYLSRDDVKSGRLALMHSLWIAALLSAMVGLLQWLKLEYLVGLFISYTDFGDRPMGNLAQPNQLATLLLIGIVALSYVYEHNAIGRVGLSLGVGFMTAVLVMTQSRSGILGALVIASFFFAKRSRLATRLSATQVVLWIALFVAATLTFPSLDRALMLGAERPAMSVTTERILIWRQVMEGIANAPWVGYGWNQTPSAHMVGALVHPGDFTFSYAHNVLLDIVAWNGVPLGGLMIALGTYWFLSRLRRLAGLDAVYAMACLLPFTVHSLVEFPFAYTYFLFSAGIMMGLVEASMLPARAGLTSRRLAGFVLSVWAVLGAYMVYEYLLIEEDFRVVRFENMRVGKTDTTYQVPDVWMLSHMATMLKVARQPAVPSMTPKQMDDLRRVSARFPWGALNLRYAVAQGLNGDPVGARKTMQMIRNMYGPGFYSAATEVWSERAKTYPQLQAVALP